MNKRRLSKNQTRRIKKQQQKAVQKAGENSPNYGEEALGPEQKGRVVAHFGTQVEVEHTNREVLRCFMRANLEPVVTGDHVIWRPHEETGVVVSRETRQSLLSRPDSYGNLKPVAANVDQIVVVVAPVPELFSNLIDRYLVIAEINDISPMLLINKSDLIDSENCNKFDELSRVYRRLGYQVITTSAKREDGISDLRPLLRNKTSIFVGQSGVGKSSIIQCLLPEEDIKVGELSSAKTKGRHTTTHSQLFHFSDAGECIDSPGIREFGLWHLDKSDVIDGFVELSELATKCRFRDCSHHNEPGCMIKRALAAGEISTLRFESYLRIVAGLDDVGIKAHPNR